MEQNRRPHAIGEQVTDQEINEAVARKLGSHWDPQVGWWRFEGQLPGKVPGYCHSIAAAWEIVGYLDPKYEIKLNWNIDDVSNKWGWFCSIAGNKAFSPMSAPMAICLAFLKLK